MNPKPSRSPAPGRSPLACSPSNWRNTAAALLAVTASTLAPGWAQEPPTANLPLARSTYFVGESIPLATTTGEVQIVDSLGQVAAAGKGGSLRLETARLSPGLFEIRIDGQKVGSFTIVPVTRRSPGAMSDSTTAAFSNQLQARSQKIGELRKQKDELAKVLAVEEANLAKAAEAQRAEAEGKVKTSREKIAKLEEALKSISDDRKDEAQITQALRDSGLAAVTLVAAAESAPFNPDLLATAQVMSYYNPYDRTSSFFGARVFEPEMTGMAERMLHFAQQNLRHPTFGGYIYHWDPVGFGRSGRYYYWGVDRRVKPGFVDYMWESLAVLDQQFKERTGLESPYQREDRKEYIRYVAGIHKPELGPAFDWPTRKWIEAISAKAPPISDTELAALEDRLTQWTRYLMGVLPEASATFQKQLHDLEPSLKNTSSHDNQFLPRDGNWPPSAYEPLDFRWVESWSDQHDGGPDYVYQWLFHAALADTLNPARQPVWVASILNGAHHNFDFPGRYARVAAQILAYDGRGLGLAVEGFTNIFGGMNPETHWGKIAGQSSGFDWELGRDFLWRFAPLQEQSVPVRQVGVLISEGQFALQGPGLGLGGSPQFEAFIHLSRLGYTPRFVTEKLVESGGLAGFDSLVVLNHFAKLPEKVSQKFGEFIQGGGRILLSKDSTTTIAGALPLDLSLPFAWNGRVYNLTAANFIGNERSVQRLEKHLFEQAPIWRAALGNKPRTALIPEGDEKSLVSTFALGGGPDATYVVATNDTIFSKSGSWARQDVKLLPNADAGANAFTALYELTEEKSLGDLAPVTAKFQDTTVRVFGLLKRPVKSVELLATQSVNAGEKLVVSVAFLDDQKQRLAAAIPFHLEIKDSKDQLVGIFDRSTGIDGRFALEFPLGVNAPVGKWSVSARSCLDGTVVTLPVEVKAGQPEKLSALNETVIARGSSAIEALWQSKPEVIAPIFDGPNKADRLAAAQAAQKALAPLGVKVDIRENPIITPYVLGWKLTPEQQQQNQPVEVGTVIGQRFINTGMYVGNYLSPYAKYYASKPLLLIQVPGEKSSPIADSLASALWPQTSALFPGPGRSVVQIIRSAFKLGVDSVIVQAMDGSGLLAGAKALAKPPADWITPSVSRARDALQQQLSIDRTPAQASGTELAASLAPGALTNRGATLAQAPQALHLPKTDAKGNNLLPPTRETAYAPKPPSKPEVGLPIPGDFPIKDGPLLAYYKPQGEWVETSEQFKNGDLRFADGNRIKVQVPQAGKYRFTTQGKFRFSDRRPATQDSWVPFINAYMNEIQPKREPMAFEILVDRQPVGRLTQTKVETAPAEISFAMSGGLNLPEELVTEISGVVELPAGEHELILVHENMVDGKLVTLSIQPEQK